MEPGAGLDGPCGSLPALHVPGSFDSVVSSEHRNAKEECCHGN